MGEIEGLEGGVFPKLSFADLEMLRAGEATGKAPPIEAHFFGMEISHIDIIRPVRDADGVMVGQVLGSFGGEFAQRVLDKISTPFGYVEVRQPNNGKNSEVMLGKRGDVEMKNSEQGYTVPVLGTRWELTFWPPVAEQRAATWKRAAIWVVFAIAVLLLMVIAYLLYRSLSRAYQADMQTIVDMARDIQARKAVHLGYHMNIRDAQGTLELLQAMTHVDGMTHSRPSAHNSKPNSNEPGPVRVAQSDKKVSGILPQQSAYEPERVSSVTLAASIFRAYDIRGVVGKTLTEEVVYNIGRAIGSEAFARGQQTIIVGRDGRLSGPKFSEALSKGLCDAGRDVIDIGQVPTPVLYFATHYLNTGSGVMVTGSHNPADYNGLKMVLKGEID